MFLESKKTTQKCLNSKNPQISFLISKLVLLLQMVIYEVKLKDVDSLLTPLIKDFLEPIILKLVFQCRHLKTSPQSFINFNAKFNF